MFRNVCAMVVVVALASACSMFEKNDDQKSAGPATQPTTRATDIKAPATQPRPVAVTPASPPVRLAMAEPASAPAEKKEPLGSPKNPVMVPSAADKITVDGDLSDWAKIKPLPAPFSKAEAGSVRLAWREEGLYGAAEIKDKKLEVDEANPWTQDCLEVWIEKDNARADDMSDNAVQLAFAPTPKAGAGKAVVVNAQNTGVKTEAIVAMWKPIEGGWALEFFIPAAEMKPAAMKEGTKLTFNYAVDDDAKAVEQFFSDKDVDEGYHTPRNWGVVQLGK